MRTRKHEYNFQQNKRLDTVVSNSWNPNTTFYVIRSGSQLVFEYKRINRDCPEVVDEEGSRSIVFELSPALQNFRADDSTELAALKAGINYSCYGCRGFKFSRNGYIEGRKINENTWHVKGSLADTVGPFVNFEADFIKQ
jgi:hypothetical protein